MPIKLIPNILIYNITKPFTMFRLPARRRLAMQRINKYVSNIRLTARIRLLRLKLKADIKNLEKNNIAFNQAHFLVVACCLFIYLTLRPWITDWIDINIVNNLFYGLKDRYLGIILGTFYFALILVLGYAIYLRYNPKTYKPTFLLIFSLLFISCLYGYERLINHHYTFIKIYSDIFEYDSPRILDPIFLIAFLFAFFFIVQAFKTPYLSNDFSFINTDQAIHQKGDDEFGRNEFIEKLAKRIDGLRLKNDQSFVIGINGKWGFGKSSVLKILPTEFKKDFIKIEFNPWIASSDFNLIKDFFNTMEDELSKHIATSNLFKKYGQRLTKIDSDKNPIKAISDFFGDSPLQKGFEELTALIKKIHKPVYVFIDDVDRLNKEEVFEVLRLVRSSACFPNMIFIIAYDRSYIEKALMYNNVPDGKRYLEKIIQLEIKLPAISKTNIKNSFIIELKKQIQLTDLSSIAKLDANQMIEYLILGNNSRDPSNLKYSISHLITDIFFNKRDIIRFSNSFVLKLSLYYNQVYLPDLFIIELFKLYLPDFYDKISFIDDNYAITTKPTTRLKILSLVREDGESFDPKLMDYIKRKYAEGSNEKLISSALIQSLLSEPSLVDPNGEFGIYYEDYYESYFNLVVPETVVSTTFIQNLISLP